jgi:predicted GNAT superfamily acetyltransferase
MESLRIANLESLAELDAVNDFLRSVWRDDSDIMPVDLGLAATHVGGYCAAAYLGDQIVAASFGFRGRYLGQDILHSHVTGSVRPGAGYELKLHQRKWAEAQGLIGITWSFDPLVRRNCVFNFTKLGATSAEYLQNFYGALNDEINLGDETDRLFVMWSTAEPTSTSTPTHHAEAVAIELPEDIEGLRKKDFSTALAWRQKIRKDVKPLLDDGWTISRMQGRTHLLIDPPKGT